MSKIALQGDASGTGTFTIAAPNSNTDRTLTLPDEAGTVLTSASDIESQVKTATNASGSAPIYACRAWVNFNGTGTVAIRASGNVSSITDNGTGDYTVNFATAMPDTNFALSGLAKFPTTDNSHVIRLGISNGTYNVATSSVRIGTHHVYTGSSNSQDTDQVHVMVFR